VHRRTRSRTPSTAGDLIEREAAAHKYYWCRSPAVPLTCVVTGRYAISALSIASRGQAEPCRRPLFSGRSATAKLPAHVAIDA